MSCIDFFDDKKGAFSAIFPVIDDSPECHRRQERIFCFNRQESRFLARGSARPIFCHILLFPDFFLTTKNNCRNNVQFSECREI